MIEKITITFTNGQNSSSFFSDPTNWISIVVSICAIIISINNVRVQITSNYIDRIFDYKHKLDLILWDIFEKGNVVTSQNDQDIIEIIAQRKGDENATHRIKVAMEAFINSIEVACKAYWKWKIKRSYLKSLIDDLVQKVIEKDAFNMYYDSRKYTETVRAYKKWFKKDPVKN